jgi:hypothetical protein
MARSFGSEGFCYYHYWFGNGRQVLERPLQEVVASGRPDFPFCICWANESWTGVWHGLDREVMIEQTYPGEADDQAHFESLLPAFKDARYMRVDGRPIFVVYSPHRLPDAAAFVRRWQGMARAAGLGGLYLVGLRPKNQVEPELAGFDASIYFHLGTLRRWPSWRRPFSSARDVLLNKLKIPTLIPYSTVIRDSLPEPGCETAIPSVVHAWDNTPRSGFRGRVLTGSSPEAFRPVLRRAFEITRGDRKLADSRLVFLKSWNEWAEGNHLEPDLRDGTGYLEVIRDEFRRECDLARPA